MLIVIDGAKALYKGVVEVFGARALIQRCREHKKRNVTDALASRICSGDHANTPITQLFAGSLFEFRASRTRAAVWLRQRRSATMPHVITSGDL
jgi:hypothetical protein